MYIRFVTPRRDEAARAEEGLFGPAYDLRRSYSPASAPWQVHEIQREITWFNAHLAVPDQFAVQPARHRGRRYGICWFRDSAAEAIGHAWYLAHLLDEMGVEVRQLRTEHPGTVLWSDRDQIVALPERDHPRLFH